MATQLNLPVTEETVPAPLSPYGTSKLMSELMIRDASTAYDLRHVILRYFNVAGADLRGVMVNPRLMRHI